ncbi:telomere repeat-binding factor 4-like isoform X2 [Euphorbia lathyris]|uniref:telomere repeat-binding factor 4-like isoform X2 n=1 Tax=Euphorbia lathyris TaxID=212925 RepID=UPI003313F94F
MGNQKQKWTAEEEEALLNGVAKHGPGKWKNILKDPDFSPFLAQRSNIDLKDKWRNLGVSNAGQSRDRSRGANKVKSLKVTVTPSSNSNAQNSALADAVDVHMDDQSNNAADGNNAPRYNAMIFEALSTIKDRNGCDISAIVHFIEQRHEVPQNFRRLLGSRLRRLVSQGKLEKVQNCYRISKDAVLGMRTSTPKPKDVRPPRHVSNSSKTLEKVAVAAAYKVAEAENKSFLAAEAVKEAERVSKMAENTNSMLQLMKEIHEQCSRGEIFVFLA